MHPSFLIGGDVNEIGTNAVWDSGEWIVVEADESDGTFLSLTPDVAVVTSVEADHLDHYGSFGALREAFERFLASARLHAWWAATIPRPRRSAGPMVRTPSGSTSRPATG